MARQFTKSGTTRGNGQDAVRNSQRKRLTDIRDGAALRSLPESSGTRQAAVALVSAAIALLDRQRDPLDKDTFHSATPRIPDITEDDWEAGKRLISELSRDLI